MRDQVNDGTTNIDETTSRSDEELARAYEQGDVDAFNTLFVRYKQSLFGFFRRRVADLALAEELTQETFIAVLRGINRYQQRAAFRNYLYAIAYRILSVHRRKAFFRANFAGSVSPEREPSSSASTETDVMMREAVRMLDRIDREVLLLREFEHLSYAEIASLLDLPVNTVRSRLFRARTALRSLLKPLPSRPLTAALKTTKERA
jgi:RNA polymerase sigma-70 factor (ECF subfamily)